MRTRSLISSTNEKKAMVGEVYLYLKWLDAVANFDGVCAGQHPQASLYFDPCPEEEDDRASPIVSRHPRRALRQTTGVQHRAGPYILIMAETYRLCHRRLRLRLCPTTAAKMPTPTQTPTPKTRASRQLECRWQSPNPPPRCAGGAWGLRGSEPGPCRACPSRFA
jgi:hypothetical protein